MIPLYILNYKQKHITLHFLKCLVILLQSLLDAPVGNYNRYQPLDVSEPAVQIAGGAGEGVRNQAVEAVKAVHQELPLRMAFSEHIALVGKDHIQHLL